MSATPGSKEQGYADCIALCYPALGARAQIIADLAAKMPQGSFSEKILMAAAALGSEAAFQADFVIATWVLNSPNYEIVILAATHGKANPSVVQVYEDKGAFHERVDVTININDITKDVTISVLEAPDGRFDGFVSII